jgi:hypothetical protein
MKVINQVDTKIWSHKHICTHCDSELEVESKDVIYHYYDGDMREPAYAAYQAMCIVCSNTFNLPQDKVPKLVKLEAEKRARPSISYLDR